MYKHLLTLLMSPYVIQIFKKLKSIETKDINVIKSSTKKLCKGLYFYVFRTILFSYIKLSSSDAIGFEDFLNLRQSKRNSFQSSDSSFTINNYIVMAF